MRKKLPSRNDVKTKIIPRVKSVPFIKLPIKCVFVLLVTAPLLLALTIVVFATKLGVVRRGGVKHNEGGGHNAVTKSHANTLTHCGMRQCVYNTYEVRGCCAFVMVLVSNCEREMYSHKRFNTETLESLIHKSTTVQSDTVLAKSEKRPPWVYFYCTQNCWFKNFFLLPHRSIIATLSSIGRIRVKSRKWNGKHTAYEYFLI